MDINSKRKESEKIERLTQEYLDRGGEIAKCPTMHHAPITKLWMIDRGMDYTPWSLNGGPGSGETIFSMQKNLGNGNSATKPARFMGDTDR